MADDVDSEDAAEEAADTSGDGFNPTAFLAATSGHGPAHGGAFDPKAFLAATAHLATPTPTTSEPGVIESTARGAAQGATFGFADEITAALEAAATGKKYTAARDESRANYHAAEAAHPIAYGAGELAGGIAPAFIPGGAVAKAVGLGAKAVEGAEALSGIGRVAHDVATGAGYGALSAVGSSDAGIDSNAGGFGQLVSDTIRGAATGGATNALLAPVARKLIAGAPKRATGDLMEAVTGNTPAKFAKKVAADAQDIEDTLFAPENHAILKNLGNTEKVIGLTDRRMETVGRKLDSLKTELDDVTRTTVYKPTGTTSAVEPSLPSTSTDLVPTNALERVGTKPAPKASIDLAPVQEGGGARLGDIVEPIESRLSTLEKQPGNGAEKRALREMLDDVKDSWSPRVKGKPVYDPDQIVSTKDLRAYTTQTQKLASNTIGSINESLASELKHDLSDTVSKIMNAHLDRAAAVSPEAANIVAQMRQLNTEYSALANMQDAFRGQAWKEITKRKSASKIIGEGAHNLGLTGAAVALATGHPLGAAAAVGAPLGLKAIDRVAVGANRWLATIARAAQAGVPRAQLIKLAIEQGAPLATAQFVASKLASH